MSLYNMLFGMNDQTDLLLAVIGLRKNDVQRFRDVHASPDGKEITVYTRTGGNNRDDYPNLAMRKLKTWRGSVDDDYDNTYCTDTFEVPTRWQKDVAALSDVLTHGLRGPFARHLAKTIRREPTDDDKATAAYESERASLARTEHFMANGHTFVPQNDSAMETALKLAEANGGELRSCWGIMPLAITVKRDFHPWPQAKAERDRANFVRVEVAYDYGWSVDEPYWDHCRQRWADEFPVTMAKIAEQVETYREKAKKRAA